MRYQEQIQQLIEREIDAGYLAGANVLALKEGKAVYEESFGFASIEKKQHMTADTIFRLYSLSKPITAVAVLILVDQGKLDLKDEISRYLPSFAHPMVIEGEGLVATKREITIFDLLTMTSGVVYPDGDQPGQQMGQVYDEYIKAYESGKVISTLEFVEQMGSCPLAFEPGSVWRYGSSADVLGAVVEVVSGMKYSEFLRVHLLEPLGMVDTGFFVEESKLDRLATVYEYDDGQKVLKPYEGTNLAIFPANLEPGFESGGAGLVSTIRDYARFAQMMLNEGELEGKVILTAETFRKLKQNYLSKEQGKTYNWDSLQGFGYGFLVRVLLDPMAAGLNSCVGTFGWDGWTGPYVAVDPGNQVVLLYFISKINTGTTPMTKKIHNLLMDGLKAGSCIEE